MTEVGKTAMPQSAMVPPRHGRVRRRSRRALRLVGTGLVTGLATFSVAVLPASVASAATLSVTSCADSGPGTLRAAVASAGSGDTITFAVTCPPSSPITLTSGPIEIMSNVTIAGPGPAELAVSGDGLSSVFIVDAGVTDAEISGITIEDGMGFSAGAVVNNGTLTLARDTVADNVAKAICGATCYPDGGGVYNSTTGTLTVTASTFVGNEADAGCFASCEAAGGGIEDAGMATVVNSTFSNNGAGVTCFIECGSLGGAIAVATGATLTLTNSTLSGNSVSFSCYIPACGGAGGDIANYGSVSIGATILADGGGGDCYLATPLTDLGYNLDDDGTCGFTPADNDYSDTPSGLDPAGLQDNGGPTQTIALDPGSVAIDHVAAILCPPTDQRGVPRHPPCDIGAYDTDGSVMVGSTVQSVIQVETSPAYAGDTVDISSSQLEASCRGVITFETLQGGTTGSPTTNVNTLSVVLDDDGNATVVVEGGDCSPGTDVVEASMTAAPYLTALTTLVVSPPVVTTAGVSGSPAAEVETGNSPESGNSDVYAVFDVETSPVYAEQTVEISAAQLESRCGQGWRFEPGNGGPVVDQASLLTPSTTLDDDGNAVFVFEGASCAAGASTVIADVEAGTHPTYVTTYTVVAPQVTLGTTASPAVTRDAAKHGAAAKRGAAKRHHHPTGSTPPPVAPAMTVTASPNPVVETGS